MTSLPPWIMKPLRNGIAIESPLIGETEIKIQELLSAVLKGTHVHRLGITCITAICINPIAVTTAITP